MADSVFTADDRVDDDALPPELVGKSAKEVALYYQRQKEILTDQLDQARRTPPAREEKPKPTEVKFDIFNDAEGSVNRVVNDRVNEALSNASAVIAPGVIGGIKVSMSTKYKDWNRFGAEIEKRMNGFTQEGQMNPVNWDYTYKIVKGENADTLIAEAENRVRNPVERSTPPGATPPKPRALTKEESDIAVNLDVPVESYLAAAERLESDGRGRFSGPIGLTISNQTRRKKAS